MDKQIRKSPRLTGYDYKTGNYYFITVCTHNKQCLFGKPGKLNQFGRIVKQSILKISRHYDSISIDNYIIMPNHIHMIVAVEDHNTVSLETIIGLFKSGISREIHKIEPDIQVWQRSFHDHIIRNQQSYEKIWQYVTYNHQKWLEDCYYVSE